MVFTDLILRMKSCNMFPLVAVLLTIIALCTFFTGCTSLQNIAQPPVTTQVPTPIETVPVVTAPVTTVPVIQTLVTEPMRTQSSDTEFLIAIDASQGKILDHLNNINAELVKDGTIGNNSPDYTALGSYARRLGVSADEEIMAMSKIREISDPANEYRKVYYVNYLNRLKPFTANLETGAVLAQKKDFNTALGFFSNSKNDLALVRSQELGGHFKVITQIKENLDPFMDVVQQQATYTVPK